MYVSFFLKGAEDDKTNYFMLVAMKQTPFQAFILF